MPNRKPAHAAPDRGFPQETWRLEARALFVYSSPILKVLNDPDTTAYDLLRALLPICSAAFRSDCRWELERVFGFVDWCWSQEGPNEDLSNAAGVAFYEHLRDHLPSDAIRALMRPDVYADLRYLLEEERPGS